MSIASHIANRTLNKKPVSFAWMIPVFIFLSIFGLQNCGRDRHHDNNKISLPISLVGTPYNFNLSSKSEESSGSLNLVSTGTSLVVSVSGCASGNAVSGFNVSTSTISLLYTGDRSCLVKLLSFNLGSTTYSASATGATNFTTWLAGDIATFANVNSSTDTIKVFVSSQVTQTGVTGSDTIVYKFTDIQSGTAKSLVQASVGSGVSLPSLTSITTPNFTIQQVNYLGTTTEGQLEFAFTLPCASSVTGASVSTYACGSYIIQSQIDYIFVPDLYSQGAITYAQATTAFQYNNTTTPGSLIVGTSGIDTFGNTLTNGGFYTASANSSTGALTTLIFPGSQQNYVLFIRGKDSLGNVLGFQYFYIDITINNSY